MVVGKKGSLGDNGVLVFDYKFKGPGVNDIC